LITSLLSPNLHGYERAHQNFSFTVTFSFTTIFKHSFKPPHPLPLSLPFFHIPFESFPFKVKLNVTLHIFKMIINQNLKINLVLTLSLNNFGFFGKMIKD
jgi:hypothetical protein